jgi:formate--tetrahydrofolate ligase
MLTDIQIAQQHTLRPIEQIAETAGVDMQDIELYGRYKAKINPALSALPARAHLVLVTAINPTAAGEGKTTTTVGLADGLRRIGKRAIVALREPSLGPVFGVKGGATGGGYAQVVPMEDINLHFTGDFHAIGAANNLLAAMLDNHIFQGNALDIDLDNVVWTRCVDMNDRQLRNIECGLGGGKNGVPRTDHFCITVASEIMAILCLATSLADLKARLGRIVVAYNRTGNPVTAHDLSAEGSMAALLKEAIKPNLVQTLEGTPALVHGGPFANIAHGCNSVIATKTAMALGEYAITEAGFGADLGAEKFLDIKCRLAHLTPHAVVIVATIRALKLHGGWDKTRLAEENVEALLAGCPNLRRHVRNITEVYGLPAVVAINRFPTDTDAEIAALEAALADLPCKVVLSDVWAQGGLGAVALAQEVVRLCDTPSHFRYAYSLDEGGIVDKIRTLARRIYGADDIVLEEGVQAQIDRLERDGCASMPICVAKTQYSFSDNAALLGAPEHFTVSVKGVKVSAGAGFVVVYTGNIMTMPGLPKVPAANHIDVDADGVITGLF